MLDEYVHALDGFDKGEGQRKEYQGGDDLPWRYWMRCPMFLRVNEGDPKPPPPSYLHQWVINADRRSRQYRANPARPGVFALDGETLHEIRKCSPPLLQRGDVVLVTFTIAFVSSKSSWYTQVVPLDLVRVASVDLPPAYDAADFAVPVVDPSTRPRLADGERLIC